VRHGLMESEFCNGTLLVQRLPALVSHCDQSFLGVLHVTRNANKIL
jgi:hypothetical protein